MKKHRLMARASMASLSLSLAWGLAAAAHAADAPSDATTVSSVTVRGEAPIVTAPTKPPLQSTYSVGTISSDVIRNTSISPTISVQTILNDQPSLFAYTNGPLGIETHVFFRGFESGQFAETYDGIAINDVFNGAVTGAADTVNDTLLLTTDIDSVQVYHGINNPSVNSYNSLAGTVNYIPRQPQGPFAAVIGGSLGSFDTNEWHVGINSGDIDGVRQMFTFSSEDSNGWSGGHTPDRNQNAYYSATYTAPNNDQLSLVLIANSNTGYDTFDTPVQLLQQNKGFFQYGQNEAYALAYDTNSLGIFDYKANLAPNVTFDNKVFASGNNYSRTAYSNPADQESKTQPFKLPTGDETFAFWNTYPAGPTYLDGPNNTAATEAGTDYQWYGYADWVVGYQPTLTLQLPHNTVTIGGNLTYGWLHSREYWFGSFNMPRTIGFNDAWNEDDTRTMASVYVQDDIKLLDDRLTITPGVKFIYAYTTDHDDIGFFYPFGGSPHDQQSFTSPTIGINYKFTSDFAAYAAFGENMKLPDITALYDNITADFVPGVTTAANSTPTTHTNPEYVQDYEVGVRYQHAGFSGSLDGYLENFTNTFIDQVNDTTGSTAVVNGGSSRYEGVEAQVMEDFGDQPWGHLKAKIDGSYNKAVYTSTFDSDADGLGQNEADVLVHSGTPVANVPQYLAYASADYTYHDWRVHANVQYRGSEFVNQSEAGVTGAVTIPSYVTFDAGITKVIPLAGFNSFAKSVKLSLNGYNLFNTYYYSEGELGSQENPITGKKTTNALYASPGAPRSFVFTAEAAF